MGWAWREIKDGKAFDSMLEMVRGVRELGLEACVTAGMITDSQASRLAEAGLTAYKAKVYVDCSGDADLAAWAGAEFQKGDEQTGEMQPGTHCFLLTNVDMYHHNHGPWLHGSNQNSPVHKMAADPEFDLIIDAHACNNIVGPGTIGFNAGHVWGVDNTDPFSLSKGLMQGRRFADQFQRALVKHHPKAYAGSFLVSALSFCVCNDHRFVALHDGDAAVGGTQINSNDFTHS